MNHRSSRTSRVLALTGLTFVLLATAAGCTTVKAHQRGKLAHPTMSAEEPVGAAEQHVYGVHEGATGGVGGSGGGCGCN